MIVFSLPLWYNQKAAVFRPRENACRRSSREYSPAWKPGDEPYYPVKDEKNTALYHRYAETAEGEERVVMGGRPGSYRYCDTDQVIADAPEKAETLK
ncbi:MAG: hypothetical protein IKG87_17040 [Clostridia bacterium]|nr:hypothetical protein [Clostridia bacterium]MBR4577261.1 hypothetical protein [Clostridia bacterium]